jgi:hypothetical protein
MQVNASRNTFWQQCCVVRYTDSNIWKESTASTVTTFREEREIFRDVTSCSFTGRRGRIERIFCLYF